MALTQKDIIKLAHLARLDLSSSEIDNMQRQLNHFFNTVEQMLAVNTVNVLPLDHPTALYKPHKMDLRVDQINETTNRSLNQTSAPLTEKGLYLVPRVLD